jgi:hypothetical protein
MPANPCHPASICCTYFITPGKPPENALPPMEVDGADALPPVLPTSLGRGGRESGTLIFLFAVVGHFAPVVPFVFVVALHCVMSHSFVVLAVVVETIG